MTEVQWNEIELNDAEKADISGYLASLPVWGEVDEIHLELFGVIRRDSFRQSIERKDASVVDYDNDHRFFGLRGSEATLEYASSTDDFTALTKLRRVNGAERPGTRELYLFPELNDYGAPGYLFLSVVTIIGMG